MHDEILKIIEEEFQTAIVAQSESDTIQPALLFEDFNRSIQDKCEIIIEMMLRNEYNVPRLQAENIATNICRKILPFLKEGVSQDVEV